MTSEEDEGRIFDEIAALAATPGFAHVVAYLCARDNFIRFDGEMRADDMMRLYSRSRLVRTEMSTLIGLMVRAGPDLDAPRPADVPALAASVDAILERLHRSLGRHLFDGLPATAMEGAAEPRPTAGSAMREPIFYGGESAFSFQQAALAIPKYDSDDAWLIRHRGAGIGDMVAVANVVGGLQAERVAATTGTGDPADAVGLLDAFTFRLEDVVPRLAIDPAVVRSCIEAFALDPANGNPAFVALSDFNVVNALPVIALGGGRFLLFHYNSLAEALYESPFYWLCADKRYAPVALAHRGDFTERFASERLEAVFGAARVHRGVDIVRGKGDTVGEIDVLVLFADRAIVLQAKSKRLTLEARKGNDLQLRGDFKAAVQDAYDQAMICAEALRDPSLRLVRRDGGPLVAPEAPTAIYPVCLVADHYPALAFQTDQFLGKREVAGVSPPLVLDVFALDAMAEFLDRPLRFLSYLDLRAMHGARVHVQHEMTLLAYHLKYNLWLDDEFDFVALDDDIAADLEIAMCVRRLGFPGRGTPDGVLTMLAGSRVDAILAGIEADPTGAMVDMAMRIAQLGGGSLRELRAGVDMVVDRARTRGGSDFVLGFDDTGIAIHCNHRPREEASEKLRLHMLMRKYRHRAESWYGLLLSPRDGMPELGLKVAFPWRRDMRVERAAEHLDRAAPAGNVLAKSERPGRNDLCHCGSGVKYKKCHLRADEGC